MRRFATASCLLTFVLCSVTNPGTAQNKVYDRFTAEQTEATLKGMNITFKKSAGKKDGIWFYDFQRNNYKIRLHNYEGKDLWIDALFTDPTTLQVVNGWNVKAKFSRAVHFKDNEGNERTSLEAQLDCVGGVTEGMVRQFISRFDGEIAAFVKHLNPNK